MVGATSLKRLARVARHERVRRKVHGTTERPRLVVFRSARHIYAQVVDDSASHTIVSACSLEKAFKDLAPRGGNRQGAAAVGKLIAERAKGRGVEAVVFDRNGYLYHGRVKVLADAAREGGLRF